MIRLRKILNNNNITIKNFAKKIGYNYSTFLGKVRLDYDFTINDLKKIKSVLVADNIINEDFDIGCFLDDVD